MKPALYRKKPVTVEAVQWTGDLTVFSGWKESSGKVDLTLCEGLTVRFYNGTGSPTYAQLGDWLIRDQETYLSVCKPDIFNQTYERVEEAA